MAFVAYQKTSLKQFGSLKYELRQVSAKCSNLEKLLQTRFGGVLPNGNVEHADRQGTTQQVLWVNIIPFKEDEDVVAAERLIEDADKMESFVSLTSVCISYSIMSWFTLLLSVLILNEVIHSLFTRLLIWLHLVERTTKPWHWKWERQCLPKMLPSNIH